jgi:hypothetical protein
VRLIGAVLLVLGLVACDSASPDATPVVEHRSPAPGDPASWTLDPAKRPSPVDDSLRVLVTRMACSNGDTGTPLAPGIVRTESSLTITINVDPLPREGGANCLGNPAVPTVVHLASPIGDRRLVDGTCLHSGTLDPARCTRT